MQDQEQVDKLLSISDRVPKLTHIVYDETRGLRDYDHSHLTSIDEVQKKARKELVELCAQKQWDEAVAQGRGKDLAIILYTSGTTGRPKGVTLTHDNVLISARNGNLYDDLDEKEEVIAYMPLAWVGDHIFSYAQSYVAGFCVNCPEAGETVVEDRREVGTTYAFAPPRIYENLLTLTMVRMEDAGKLKRRMFHYFIDFARKWGEKILNKERVPLHVRLIYWLGEGLVYAPLKKPLRAVADPCRLYRGLGEAGKLFPIFATGSHKVEIRTRHDGIRREHDDHRICPAGRWHPRFHGSCHIFGFAAYGGDCIRFPEQCGAEARNMFEVDDF